MNQNERNIIANQDGVASSQFGESIEKHLQKLFDPTAD